MNPPVFKARSGYKTAPHVLQVALTAAKHRNIQVALTVAKHREYTSRTYGGETPALTY